MAKTVLIAEDEPSLLNMLSKRVHGLGYNVVQAIDGVDTIAKIKADKPDLILLDIIMPKKNGLDVLQELRVTLKNDVPVIILSNLDRDDDITAAKSYNVQGYLIKSNVSIRELSTSIAGALA